jgi:hypothetical protein
MHTAGRCSKTYAPFPPRRSVRPRFVAFDLLWCEGEELRYLPSVDRKQRLRSIVRNSVIGSSTAITSSTMGRPCSGWLVTQLHSKHAGTGLNLEPPRRKTSPSFKIVTTASFPSTDVAMSFAVPRSTNKIESLRLPTEKIICRLRKKTVF